MVDFTKRKTSQLAITVLFILSIVLGSSTIKAQCKPGYVHVGTWSDVNRHRNGTLTFEKSISGCAHDSVYVSIDLGVFYTWDGIGDYCCGPDVLQFRMNDSLFFQTSFSRTKNKQSYPSQFDPNRTAQHKAGTGRVEDKDWGRQNPEGDRYILKFTLPHSSPNLSISVTSWLSGVRESEYWKLLNITVCTHEVRSKLYFNAYLSKCKDTVEFRGHKFSHLGAFVVSVPNGCLDSVFTVYIGDSQLPNAGMAGPTKICQYDTSQFVEIFGIKPNQFYQYSYRINGGPIQAVFGDSANRAFIRIPSASDRAQVIRLLRVEDQLGMQCVRNVADSVVIQVQSAPILQCLEDTVFCQFEKGNFEFQSLGIKGPYSCWYSLNGMSIQRLLSDASGKFSIPISTDDPGRQAFAFLKLTDNSDMRCSHQLLDTGYVIVAPLPSASIKDDVVSCPKDSSVIVEFSGWGYQSPYTFYYQVMEGATQALVSDVLDKARIDVSLSQSGLSQIALLKVVDGSPKHCASDMDERIEIEVLNGPIAKFKYSPNWVVESTEWVDFYSACEGKDLRYRWFCDDQPFGDGENARKQLGDKGSYRIKLTVTDSNGCIGEEEVVVQVSEDFKVFIPNAFTPNGNDLNEGFYPVCSGLHSIEWIKIYNRWGEQIYASVQPWDGRYHGGLVPEGIYIYEICVSDVQSTKYNFEGSLHVMR